MSNGSDAVKKFECHEKRPAVPSTPSQKQLQQPERPLTLDPSPHGKGRGKHRLSIFSQLLTGLWHELFQRALGNEQAGIFKLLSCLMVGIGQLDIERWHGV